MGAREHQGFESEWVGTFRLGVTNGSVAQPSKKPQNFPTVFKGCPSEDGCLIFGSRCKFSDRVSQPG
jgi:hypothetical protein